MIRLGSSLRAVAPEATLVHARAMAERLGVSRVTDATRLDRIGIPVFTSVRPGAAPGTLCVNSGKGVRPVDAQVGAYMEAIEFALAEPGASEVRPELATARDVLDGHRRPSAILDFCPRLQQGFDLDAPLAVVETHDLVTDAPARVPAELVLLPYVAPLVDAPGTGSFGSHSNGLASGNSVAEATLHGLLEVIERDVRSFQAIRDTSRRVRTESLPPPAREQVRRVEAAGLEICVRWQPDGFGTPCFEALIWDRFARGSLAINGGYGCHLFAEIALLRAISEAAQSRMSWIHGGRDDLVELDEQLAAVPMKERVRGAAAEFARYAGGAEVDYAEAETRPPPVASIDQALDHTLERVLAAGLRHVCRVAFTPPDEPLQVVRVVVPGMEYFDRSSRRVGPRLHEHIRNRLAAA
ncbi:YcaO-like family protein [Longimicrobium sp.]|uniref:YcaO-like family protein n=1 Tax=Longimicrobium sp. TaxID=2029185 RepID=UPI002C16517C|nr:YcaO-like family protein [Longimicrobium sp.]HSU17054.1 YcaO-like family protein [Longimicrobium sp.]